MVGSKAASARPSRYGPPPCRLKPVFDTVPIARAVVLLVAGVQVFFIAAFGYFALSNDSWGIARALALGLSLPFVALTVPALVLLWRHWVRTALALALLSLAAFWLLWRFA
jgi:hypothetical protein